MVWDNVEVKLPAEVLPGLLLDSRNRFVYSPNVGISIYGHNERLRGTEDRLIGEDSALYKSMNENACWLVDHFRDSVVHKETTYGAPRVRSDSSLGFMFGVRSKYMQGSDPTDIADSDCEGVGSPELASLMSIFGKDLSIAEVPGGEHSDDDNTEPALCKRMRSVRDNVGVEGSDEDLEGVSSCDAEDVEGTGEAKSTSPDEDHATPVTGDEKPPKNRRIRVLDGEQFPDFENTLVHDYYIRSDSSHLDISDIEARLFRDQKSASSGVAKGIRKASNELAKSLLSLLEKCDVVEFSRLVSNFRFPPTKVKCRLVHDMSIWKSWLINGQHLCFYGAGSKRQIMKAFANVALRDGYVITVNAYHLKGSSCDGLWYMLKDELLSRKIRISNAQECKAAVASRVEAMRRPFYIILLGLDLFVSRGAFNSLVSFIKIPNVRLIGTLDHLRSSLVVSAVDRSLRNYRLVRLSTGLDYRKELISTWDRIPPSYILTTETTKSADEVHGIISALSVNHRQLFSLIARIQLEECRRKGRFDGIDKYGLLRDRRAVTICNTENKLDALLTEFVTHNLVEQSRGPGGKFYLMIPFRPGELEQFVNL